VAAATADLRASNRQLLKRIAENDRITQDLLQQSTRLRTILESAAEGILTMDEHRTIRSANPAAERMFGYRVEELLGRNLSLLVPSSRPRRSTRAAMPGSFSQHDVWREDVGRRKDGTTFPIDLVTSEFYDGKLRLTGIVRDITEQRRLQREIVQRVTEEQQSIGRSLHDGVAQQVTAAEMLLGVLANRLRSHSPADLDLAAEALRAVGEAQKDLRVTIRGVLPYTVDTLGLDAALSQLAASTGARGIECEFVKKGTIAISDSYNATQLYYIASEAVHNAVRHARSKRIVITLKKNRLDLELSVRDDGKGIRPQNRNGGAGLQIMNYRAGLIGASLDIQQAEGGGTVVTCVYRTSPAKHAIKSSSGEDVR
jgi:PAS domain S-box-containing protein